MELQALVAPTELVPPRRIANGVDRNRLALCSLSSLGTRLAVGSSDVFVSAAGACVEEPGADLGIAPRGVGGSRRPPRRRTPPARRLRRGRPDRRAARGAPGPPRDGGREVRAGAGVGLSSCSTRLGAVLTRVFEDAQTGSPPAVEPTAA